LVKQHNHHLPVGSKLKYGIILTSIILVMELVGGLLSNSLALLSDAGHVFADVVALSLSWYGVRQAERSATSRMTFGYHRVGVIIAIVNALSIFAIGAIILYEAYSRWQQPPEVNSLMMMVVAIIGLSANVFVIWWLRKDQRKNLNVRSAFWHALGDALASIGVILGGALIYFTGLFILDPIVGAIIGIIIIVAAWGILKEGMKVILEATPHQINVTEMVTTLEQVPGVKGVHDVHVWSISPEIHAMSSHIVVDDIATSQASNIRSKIEDVLKKRFDIEHSTIQMECDECNASDLFCNLIVEQGHDEAEHKDKEN
jgi:cobalt-zinc-cadmium efflux system protein